MTTLKTLKTLLLTSALGLALGLPSLDASRALAQGEPPPSAEPGTADSPENDAEDAAESRATGFRAVSMRVKLGAFCAVSSMNRLS